jgi:NFU1 iron-sulfur cluster scaffold homolog, mitochondrial
MSTPFVLEIYTESTPNPESQKFVTNMHLLPNYVAEYRSKESATESELAQELFDIPFVAGVFISNEFVTITKKPEYEWYEITPELKDAIRKFIHSGRPVVSESLFRRGEAAGSTPSPDETEAETKIKELLDKYVKPAVEGDGGHIAFRSFQDGVVNLSLQGSCSGCPSSSITLKSGIEGLLKRMVPEVKEVVAVEE